MKVKVYTFGIKPNMEDNLHILEKMRNIYAKKEQVKLIYNVTELGITDLIQMKEFMYLFKEFNEDARLYLHSSECIVKNILVKKAAENILMLSNSGLVKPFVIRTELRSNQSKNA